MEALPDDSDRLDGYLDIVPQILLISPEEVAKGVPSLSELSFFDLLEELEGVAERIDNGDVQTPLPFSFYLVGDALFGWKHVDEEDFCQGSTRCGRARFQSAMCGKTRVLARPANVRIDNSKPHLGFWRHAQAQCPSEGSNRTRSVPKLGFCRT